MKTDTAYVFAIMKPITVTMLCDAEPSDLVGRFTSAPPRNLLAFLLEHLFGG